MDQVKHFVSRYRLDWIAAILLAGYASYRGMEQLHYATVLGPLVGGDSTIYITSARSFLAGQGLGWITAKGAFRLLPYFAPFYPLVLSLVGLFFGDLTAAARWLNIGLYGGTIAVSGLSFFYATRRPLLSGLLAGLVASSSVLLGVNAWAMSEALCLFTGFSGLALLLVYFETRRFAWLYAAALLAGLAFLTRYAGVAFVGAIGLAWLVDQKIERRGEKIALKPLLLSAALSLLPMAVWLVIDVALTGTVSSRSAQPTSAYLQRFLDIGPALESNVLHWYMLDERLAKLSAAWHTALWLVPLLASAMAAVLFDLRWRALGVQPRPVRAARLAALMAAFILLYLVVLAFVQVFTFPPVTLAERMFSPIHLAVLIFAAAMAALGAELFFSKPRWLSLAVSLAVCLVFYLALSRYNMFGSADARGYHYNGGGYNTPAWQSSPVIAAVKKLPPSLPLITNDETAIMYLVGRPAYPLLEMYSDTPLKIFTAYGQGEDDAQRAFREQHAALVLFTGLLRNDFSIYGERVDERIAALTKGLYLYYQGEDGAIYFYNSSSIGR